MYVALLRKGLSVPSVQENFIHPRCAKIAPVTDLSGGAADRAIAGGFAGDQSGLAENWRHGGVEGCSAGHVVTRLDDCR